MSAALAAVWLGTLVGHWIWTGRASLGRWWGRLAWITLAGFHVAEGADGVAVALLCALALALFLSDEVLAPEGDAVRGVAITRLALLAALAV